MSRSLVLGANGFIGSHLVDALARNGDEVRAFDRFSGDTLYEPRENIEKFAGDFLNTGDLKAALQGIDHVYHFISTTSPATSENDPTIDIETNIRMSVELFQLCVEEGVKKVFFASTGGAIYGENTQPPFSETDLPLPISPYAIGKLTIESYLRYFRRKHGLRSVALRISNPYGERQPFHRKQGVIPIFLERIYRNEPITVLGDGSMVRDYIYVKDVADMIVNIAHEDATEEMYNLGSGQGNTIQEILEIAEQVSGKKATVQNKPIPSTFVDKAVLDTSRFTEEFHLTPKTNLHEGMQKTYDYIKQEIERE